MRRRPMLFVALFLMIAGVTILLENVLGLHFNTFSVLFAEAILLGGIYLITRGNASEGAWESGGPTTRSQGREETVFFANTTIEGTGETTNYTVVFSSATIILPEDGPEMVDISGVFSTVRVILPKNRAVRVKLSAAFASCAMPNSQIAGFGTREALLGEGAASYLAASAVFSSMFIA